MAWCALLMVASQIYISGSVESWTVAGAFGQRRFVGLTILLTIGLAELQRFVSTRAHHLMWRPRAVAWARAAVVIPAAICVWWNLALMAEFGAGLMDRQRLDIRRNAYDAFVTFPRAAPSLVWRYLTARESFYKPAQP